MDGYHCILGVHAPVICRRGPQGFAALTCGLIASHLIKVEEESPAKCPGGVSRRRIAAKASKYELIVIHFRSFIAVSESLGGLGAWRGTGVLQFQRALKSVTLQFRFISLKRSKTPDCAN